MTNTVELERLIRKSGLKKGYIAITLGLSRQALSNKINNKSIFTATEISTLCNLLNITSLKDKERIFFALDVI